MSAILEMVNQTKPIFEFNKDIDDGKACIKFRRNLLRNVIVVTNVDSGLVSFSAPFGLYCDESLVKDLCM